MYKSTHNSGRALLSTSMEAAFKHAELGHWLDAKKILDGLTSKYSEEGWSDILTEIYLLLRDCSMHLSLPSDYVTNSLHLIQPNSALSLPAKCEIQRDIYDIVLQTKDDREINSVLMNPLGVGLYTDNASGAEPLLFLRTPISITNIESFFHVKFNFTKKNIHVQETSDFVLEVTSFLPTEIDLTDLVSEFSNSLSVSFRGQDGEDELKFVPNVPKRFSFPITPSASGYLKVSSISMILGQGQSKISFVYIPDYSSPSMTGYTYNRDNKDILIVNERPSKIDICSKHETPSILGEFYSYTIVLKNNHDKPITSGLLSVTTQFQNTIFLTRDSKSNFFPQAINTPVPPGESTELEVFIEMTTLEERIIDVSFQYSLQESKCLDMATSFRENVSVLSPFSYTFNLFDENRLQVTNSASFQSKKPFFICVSLKPLTPYPLDVVKSEIVLSEGEKYFDVLNESADFCIPEVVGNPVSLSKESNYQLWYKLCPTEECPTNVDISVGSLKVTYARRPKNESDELVLLTSKSKIQQVRFETPLFTIDRCFSPSCVLGKVIYDKVVIKSCSTVSEDLSISLEESPHFFASGPGSSEFSIVPGGTITISFAFVPLETGQFTLPNIQISQQNKKKIPCPKKIVYVYPF